jgi:hypothetical protein
LSVEVSDEDDRIDQCGVIRQEKDAGRTALSCRSHTR